MAGDEGGGDGGRRGEVAHGGRARGEMGWGHQRAVWEQQKCIATSKPNNWSDLAGDEGGGMEGGQAGRWSNKRCTDSPFLAALETGELTRVGGGGGGVGRWPMSGGQGGRWGGGGMGRRGPEGGQGGRWGAGMGGGVGRWPMEGGQGGRWGGAPESSVGARFWAPSPNNWSDLAGDEGGGMGEAWGGGPWRAGGMGGGVPRWPMEGGQVGTREQCGRTKGALVLLLGSLKTEQLV